MSRKSGVPMEHFKLGGQKPIARTVVPFVRELLGLGCVTYVTPRNIVPIGTAHERIVVVPTGAGPSVRVKVVRSSEQQEFIVCVVNVAIAESAIMAAGKAMGFGRIASGGQKEAS
jgi:hypothetical protein